MYIWNGFERFNASVYTGLNAQSYKWMDRMDGIGSLNTPML